MEVFAGTGYAISLFTELFKNNLFLSQEQVDSISSSGNAGLYTAVLGGLFYNRCGPRATALIGGILIGTGYLGMYGCIRSVDEDGSGSCGHSTLGFLNFVAQHGSGWIASAAVATSLRNFSIEDRGVAVGIAKGAFGISSAFVAELYVGIYEPNSLSFLLFLGICAPVVILLCVPYLVLVPVPSRTDAQRNASPSNWTVWIALLLMLGVFLVGTALAQQTYTSTGMRTFSLIGTLVLVSSFVLLPKYGVSEEAAVLSTTAARRTVSIEMTNRGGALSLGKNAVERIVGSISPASSSSQNYTRVRIDESNVAAEEGNDRGMESREIDEDQVPSMQVDMPLSVPPRHGGRETMTTEVENKSLCDVLRSLEFYLLFISFTVGAGSGLMYVNNLTQIVQSIGGENFLSFMSTKDVLIVLFGAANLYGRIVFGMLSDRLGGRENRAFVLGIAICIMGIAHLIVSAAQLDALYPLTILVGMSFGAVFSLVASLVGDMFGPKYFAGNYGAADFAPCLGSILFSTVLAGGLYDRETQFGADVCYGPRCFAMAFQISSAVCMLLGVPIALLLWFVNRHTLGV